MRMSIKKLIKQLLGFVKYGSPQIEKSAESSEKFVKLLKMLDATREEELTCDEVFSLLDEFTELAVKGEDVGRLMPLIQRHLDQCDDCREEYVLLESILKGRQTG